jgi:predicted CXXCH cytochrome family protein
MRMSSGSFHVAGLLIALLVIPSCRDKAGVATSTVEAVCPPPLTDADALSTSSTCAHCHADIHETWSGSHHGLAHRDTGSTTDAEAFADQEIPQGSARWKFSGGAEKPTIEWQDGEDKIGGVSPMAIGLTPLVQYLLATGDGRYQVPDMAWDPEKKEWFSIFGADQRSPEEWGHWTQRGMNWNSQCAFCHFTGLRKNHDGKTDGYKTTWVEQGVGCAQCHGPDRPNPGTNDCRIDPARQFTTEQWTHSCATCHARREEFDEHFTTGRSFHDHYQLALPSQPGLWFPDGQQLDEDYNFTSLLLSRMGHKGIGCTDCHDPHAAIPKGGDVAVRSNALCMSCHAGGTQGAVVIDPATHTRHAPGTPGAGCVDCHMPKRSYMGRDPRSDHRFPRPDPLLTKELGVPNACNDCHSDKGVDWQIKHTHEWYGEDMNHVNRQRTRAIHAAQQGRTGALDLLVEAMKIEEIDAWQATLLRLMEPWAGESRVVRFTNVAIQEGAPLARSAAAMLIGRRGEDGELLDKALNDPLKAVRVEAGWAALERLPRDHPVIAELEEIARHQSDQPGGAMRLARIAMSRGETTTAGAWMKKAADWDRTSPAPRRDLAVFLGGIGRTAESIRWLEEAAALEPGNPEIVYLAALAHAETGDNAKAEEKLRKAVEIDPSYSRAWYNLGLLLAGGERVEEAMECLIRAEKTDPGSADAPYARATILYRLGRLPEARAATLEALRRHPEHPPANQLIQELGGR